MSNIRGEYQKQTNAFCEQNNTISALDIWNKAQNRTPTYTEEKVVEFKPKKSRGVVWKAAIPAVICFLLVGTTTMAATGHLSDLSNWFRNLFKDEKTAEIIDAGYYETMDMMIEDEVFEVHIIGVSGDTENSQVALDIYVKDEALTQNRDEIYLEAYCMSTYEYENNKDNYAVWDAEGIKDKKIDNLYHVKLRTGLWIASGEECILEITKISLGGYGVSWQTMDVSMKYTLQVDRDAFYQMTQYYMEDAIFEYKGIKYELRYLDFGYYYTTLLFYNMDAKKPTEDNKFDNDCTMDEYEGWKEFIQQVVLEVDGVDYKVNPGEENRPWYEYDDGGYTHMHPYFQPFIHDDISSIKVKVGDNVYVVK